MALFLRAFLAVLVVFFAASCSTTPGGEARLADSAERSIATSLNAAATYLLAPGDRISVYVFGDEKVSGEFTVDAGGNITVPLIGAVKASGMTIENVGNGVGARLAEGGFVTNPRVTAEIVSFRPFYILGEVNKPGEYAFRPGMSLFAAVATAGGYSYRGDHLSVLIRKSGETEAVRYDLSDGDIGILPGDVIQIPQRFF